MFTQEQALQRHVEEADSRKILLPYTELGAGFNDTCASLPFGYSMILINETHKSNAEQKL